MSAINDGGPALPVQELNADGTPATLNLGASLRDYFAVHANIGDVDEITAEAGVALIGRACPTSGQGMKARLEWWADVRAAKRYIEADAMLRARGQQ